MNRWRDYGPPTLAILVVFVSGFYLGRVSAPSGMDAEEVRELMENSRGATTPSGVFLSEILPRYRRLLNLTNRQRRTLTPMFREAAERMLAYSVGSDERLHEMKRLHEAISPYLNESQKKRLDQILNAAREQIDEGP